MMEDFKWYRVMKPQSPHLRAMLATSPVKKGIFYHEKLQMWLPIMKSDFQARPYPVYFASGTREFAVPFYDPGGVILARLENSFPPDDDLRGAAAIYVAGQVRLGSLAVPAAGNEPSSVRQSTALYVIPRRFRCASPQGPFVTGSARRVFLLGETLAERLARCSVSRMLTVEAYQDMCRLEDGGLIGLGEATGFIGLGVFIGESKETVLWFKQLLF